MKERSALSNKKYAAKHPITTEVKTNIISLKKEGMSLINKMTKPTVTRAKLKRRDGLIT